MPAHINLGAISVDLVFKDIKNIHLSVHPPTGRVRIAAPEHMDLDKIRVFAISKLEWIKKHQTGFMEQDRETPREYLERESHYLWGKRYLLRIHEAEAPSAVEISPGKMHLCVRPRTSQDEKRAIVSSFYRDQVREEAPPLMLHWQRLLGVAVDRFYVRQMKTKWGTSHPAARSIRLNTELAKKPKSCLEYIVLHEMVHFIDCHHGDRFAKLMDTFMPDWRLRRASLNNYPLGHEHWDGRAAH